MSTMDWGRHLQDYFDRLTEKVQHAFEYAKLAREKGYDPELAPEIYLAKDAASRVEGLVGPPGVAKRIRELEHKFDSKEKIAFTIAGDILDGMFGEQSPETLAEQAIRTALGVLTEGITSSPIEGISALKIRDNPDGSSYLAIYYAGPIRAAGGTAAAVSVLLADFIRQKLQIPKYVATPDEIERMVEEVHMYKKVVNLQIPTTEDQLRYATKHLPIQINGDPTEDEEVSGYRNIPRIETNHLRGGACLVLNDGVVGRAKKLLKRVKIIELEGWDWLKDVASMGMIEQKNAGGNKSKHPTGSSVDTETEPLIEPKSLYTVANVEPSDGYLRDVIAGRPIFGHPSRKGTFRLRYGRARNTGIAGVGIHPATMGIVFDFLASGTHVRTERPGKGSIVAPVDSIHPPIVLLEDGSVRVVRTYQESLALRDNLKKILFIGDMLVSFAEYTQNNYKLTPQGYVEEWWVHDLKHALYTHPNAQDFYSYVVFLHDPFTRIPTFEDALFLSKSLGIPLHPAYTPFFDNLTTQQVKTLRAYFMRHSNDRGNELPYDPSIKDILEDLWIPHHISNNKIIFDENWGIILRVLLRPTEQLKNLDDTPFVMDFVNQLSPVTLRPKGGTYIGARMGRPEKSSERRGKTAIHGLFPISELGSNQRLLTKALEQKKPIANVELITLYCENCKSITHHITCPNCGQRTTPKFHCPKCNTLNDENICSTCNHELKPYNKRQLDLKKEVAMVRKKIGQLPKNLKLVKGLANPEKLPEPLIKGVMRARYDLAVFRDGTIRYDSTDAPLTHFKPEEINVSVEKLRELGYYYDAFGHPLERSDQLLELKIQDIIMNKDAAMFLYRVSKFIDEELQDFYGMEPYYNYNHPRELIGEIVIALAPHTSAGIIARVIGFTNAKMTMGHPFFHAAKRRNCLYPHEKLPIWDKKQGILFIAEIQDLVETDIHSQAPQQVIDSYGTIGILNLHPEYYVFSVDPRTNEPILQPIAYWVKGENTMWLTITTQSGRTLTLTPDHIQYIWDDQNTCLVTKPAYSLQEGDTLLVQKRESQLRLITGSRNLSFESHLPSNNTLLSLTSKASTSLLFNNLDFSLDPIISIHTHYDPTKASYCLVNGDLNGNAQSHAIVMNNGLVTHQCDGDEDGVILMLDGFLNFSKRYLPTRRGSRMDAPLVLVVNLDPLEVDDEAHNLDVAWSYPYLLYESSWKKIDPTKFENIIDNVHKRLNTNLSIEGFGATHPTSKIFDGPKNTAYKDLGAMKHKLDGQIKLAELLAAVDHKDVVKRIIEKHFIPDIMGNLRKFGGQTIRCVKCNAKYRRVPLTGKCKTPGCDGKLVLTIYPKSVTKYLYLSQELAKKYDLSIYLQGRLQSLNIGSESLYANGHPNTSESSNESLEAVFEDDEDDDEDDDFINDFDKEEHTE